MVKARCPDCDELVQIHDTGEVQTPGKSSHWWTFVRSAQDAHEAGNLPRFREASLTEA